jgi:regulatory protein
MIESLDEEVKQARFKAFHLLKFRLRSEKELRQRLGEKGFSSAALDRLIDDLKAKGFVDDAKLAHLMAAQKTAFKPMGRRLMLAQLKAKGIDTAVAKSAVETETAGQDEAAVIRELAQQRLSRMRGLGRDAAERRLVGFLARRGFSADKVYRVVRELTKEGIE